MDNKPWQIFAAENSDTAEILIYGDIGGFDWNTWEEINTAKQFKTDFTALEGKYNRINVRINSYGGIVAEGLAIGNIIAQSKADVHTYIDGVAMSMAAVIALSAPKGKVHMAKNGILMIHNAWTISWGNAKQLAKASEDLKVYDRSLALMLVDRLGVTEDKINEEYLNYEDHYFNSDEAKELGLVDHVEDYDSEADIPSASEIKDEGYFKVAAKKMDQFKNDPSASAKFLASMKSRIQSKANNKPNEAMTFENLQKALNEGKLDNVLTAAEKSSITEEVNAVLDKGNVITQSDLDAANSAKDKAVQDLSAVNETITAISTAVDAKEGEDVSAKVQTLVSDLAEANANLAKINNPEGSKEGDDLDGDDDPLANLPHNKRADEAKQKGSIY